jgi:serine/threonine protein kinase
VLEYVPGTVWTRCSLARVGPSPQSSTPQLPACLPVCLSVCLPACLTDRPTGTQCVHSVDSLLARFGPLPDGVLSAYTRQLLSALAYMHNVHVVHRDIKVG